MKKCNKIAAVILSVVLFSLFLNGCYPDRHPVSPQEYSTHRPDVLYKIPAEGDSVNTDMKVELWFDGLMDLTSLEDAFSVSLTVADEPWNVITTALAADQSYSNSQKLFLSITNRGALYSDNNGMSWQFINSLANTQIRKFKIDPQNDALIYALTTSKILKSSDNGQNWRSVIEGIDAGTNFMTLDFDPSNSDRIWIGTSSGIYYSDDAAASWQKKGELPSWSGQEISAIAVDPKNSNILYTATRGRFIYKTENSGADWSMLRGETDRLPTSQIYDIVIDPIDSKTLFAATINRGVYKSEDSGLNWTAFNTNLSDLNARKLKFDYNTTPGLYLATTDKLFHFDSDSLHWQELALLENGTIYDFHFSTVDNNEIKLIQGGKVFYSADKGDIWSEINSIEQESIKVKGMISFEKWRGEKIFIDAAGDTVVISPYVNTDALAAYNAGFISDPPVDPNPYATMLEFTADDSLFSSWKYMILIRGAFDSNVWRGVPGARNLNGMSLEFDDITYINVR